MEIVITETIKIVGETVLGITLRAFIKKIRDSLKNPQTRESDYIKKKLISIQRIKDI
jgi:hypothetical protein